MFLCFYSKMASNGKNEINEHEIIYHVSIESALRMMNCEFFAGNDLVTSTIRLPSSMNNYVYAQGATSEKIWEVCREQYLKKHQYKEPKVFVHEALGEVSFIFDRYIDDVYPEDWLVEDDDDYLDPSRDEGYSSF